MCQMHPEKNMSRKNKNKSAVVVVKIYKRKKSGTANYM